MPLATKPLFAVTVPLTLMPSLICMAVESVDEIELMSMSLLPVIVRVSPDTAVVILLVPAILKVPPEFTEVPVESSPTNVIACAVFCASM